MTIAILAGLCSAPASAQDWSYSLTPYIWATGLDGEQGFAGRTVEVDAGFGDLVEFLDFGFAAHIEGQTDRWGWFGDVFYSKLSDEKNLPAATLDGETTQTIMEAGLTYRLTPTLEGLAGLRYQESDLELTLAGVGSIDGDESWVDGFVGARWTPVQGNQWRLWLRGDVGAGESDFVWHAAAGVGYSFNERYALIAGYRHLDTDYESDGFTWDIAQSGLGLGLEIAW